MCTLLPWSLQLFNCAHLFGHPIPMLVYIQQLFAKIELCIKGRCLPTALFNMRKIKMIYIKHHWQNVSDYIHWQGSGSLPSCCWWLLLLIQNDAKVLKSDRNLANGYSCESTQQELSNEYQHDRVLMIFKFFASLCFG